MRRGNLQVGSHDKITWRRSRDLLTRRRDNVTQRRDEALQQRHWVSLWLR